MNRRKAIFGISLAGLGAVFSFGGYEWYSLAKTPDLPYLTQNKSLLAALAEIIIPATDSPGAKDAGVQDFIMMMIKECTDVKTQNKFIGGLKDLQQRCKEKYGHDFERCSNEQQVESLEYAEQIGRPSAGFLGKVQTRFLGKSFFITLKEYTVEGYCTSEPGATKGLAYLYIPGRFEGCTTILPEQKAWATN